MGLYRRYFAPVLVDTACSPKALGKWRVRVVENLGGDVVEIGFGAGRNLPFYPTTVTSLTAVEPSAGMRQRGAKRIAALLSVVLTECGGKRRRAC